MYYAGIDIGSASTDIVVVDSEKNIVYKLVKKTGSSHANIVKEILNETYENLKCNPQDIGYIVGTGYGRRNINMANRCVTEITCHTKGAFYLCNECRTVIDIGGQDSKVIKLDEFGNVIDFMMNEKCAAGTGRFLEVMSRVLNVPISGFGELGLKSTEKVKLSSTCAVFAESEVVSLIAEEIKVEDIINGIHESISNKIVAMADRVGYGNKIVMTGGVARNEGLVQKISEKLNMDIFVPFDPQIVGALGAALFAAESGNDK